MARPVDYVDLIALLQQVSRPAGTSIRSAHPVEPLATAAVYQHDRIRMFHLGRNLVLDIHLFAIGDGAARQIHALHAHPEEAPLGDIERCLHGRCSRGIGRHCGVGQQRTHGRSGGDKIPAADPALFGRIGMIRIHGGRSCLLQCPLKRAYKKPGENALNLE